MKCLVLSKDTGKTVTPEGTWEVQLFAPHLNPILCTILALALALVVRHEFWGVRPVTVSCN